MRKKVEVTKAPPNIEADIELTQVMCMLILYVIFCITGYF